MNSHKRGFWSRFVMVLLIVLAVAGAATAKLTRFVQDSIKQVVLDDDGYRVEITTYDSSVEEVLNRYKITLGPGDEITPAPEQALQNNTEIIITRAMPVTVEADGKKEVLHVTRGTAKDMLEKAGVKLREMDYINHPMQQQVKPYDHIRVTRMDEEMIIETEAIAYQVISKKNNQMDEGTSKIVQEGQQGELERRTLVTYQDGVEIDRKLVSEQVTKEPVDRIVEKGTVKRIKTSRGDYVRYSKSKKMTATAYTAGYESTGKSPGDKGYGITSSGRKAKPHHTIAASKDIPIGTKVYIPELVKFWAQRGVSISGIFTVEDRGGAISGNKIDIYMEDTSMTRSWGRRKVTVYFIK
jgi:uncharacterized protein YabE (DUF348 family)